MSMSMGDYFRLLGADCSKTLRDKLDVSLHLLNHPTSEKYADVSHDYNGDCKLRMPDGRCYIHAELGEHFLPDVCKMYPRGVRKGEVWECSCANSCEAVIEYFLSNNKQIVFKMVDYTTDYPDFAEDNREHCANVHVNDIRMRLIDIMQNKQISLPQRLILLGKTIVSNVSLPSAEDAGLISNIISKSDTAIFQNGFIEGVEIMIKLLRYIDSVSLGVKSCGEEALNFFCQSENVENKYQKAKENFHTKLPDNELLLENLLVNHMFFSRFPCLDCFENPFDGFLSICLLYAMLRFIGVACVALHDDTEKLVDAYASVFRFVDHTDFHNTGAKIMRLFDCTTPERVYSLLSL